MRSASITMGRSRRKLSPRTEPSRNSAHNGGMPQQINGPVLNEYEHLQVQRALVQLVDAPFPSSTDLLGLAEVVDIHPMMAAVSL